MPLMHFRTIAVLVLLGHVLLLFLGGIICAAWQKAEDRRGFQGHGDSRDTISNPVARIQYYVPRIPEKLMEEF